MLIKSIKLTNFLSFGESSQELELRPLNVIIGPNGSGKSNILEAIDLLRAAPRDILAQVRVSGGAHDLIWKGAEETLPEASINIALEFRTEIDFHYSLNFTEVAQRFVVLGEHIKGTQITDGKKEEHIYCERASDSVMLMPRGETSLMPRNGDIDIRSSILAQRKDPDQYPTLTWIGDAFEKIRIYRDWKFGRRSMPRLPQKTDLPNYFMEPDCSNLGLVLNQFHSNPESKKKLLNALQALYENIDDFGVRIEGGTVQTFLQEGRYNIPATRLSDGTLRYLCLLAILCHPNPPPLICIEEPELGLHPDVLPTLASLLVDASERTQLIVTTHSEILVDALTEQPEAIVVAEKGENGTTLKRLNFEHLKPWLEKYRLGQLWTSGEIGGTRW